MNALETPHGISVRHNKRNYIVALPDKGDDPQARTKVWVQFELGSYQHNSRHAYGTTRPAFRELRPTGPVRREVIRLAHEILKSKAFDATPPAIRPFLAQPEK